METDALKIKIKNVDIKTQWLIILDYLTQKLEEIEDELEDKDYDEDESDAAERYEMLNNMIDEVLHDSRTETVVENESSHSDIRFFDGEMAIRCDSIIHVIKIGDSIIDYINGDREIISLEDKIDD